MAESFNSLRSKMSSEAQKKAREKTGRMLKEMPLQALRQARSLSQEEIARSLHVKQAAVSKMERRTDMYISTLRKTLKAMGGDLQIIANFPEGKVIINQFEDVEAQTAQNLQEPV